jgi:hypothetical protein
MTLLHYDTPLIRHPDAHSQANRLAPALQLALRIVRSLGDGLTRLADARRRRREQRALENLPFDLRKDLGWPAGDIRRQ